MICKNGKLWWFNGHTIRQGMLSIKVEASRMLYSTDGGVFSSFVTCVDHTPHRNQFVKIREVLVQRLCDTFVMNIIFEMGQDDVSARES